MTQPNQPEPQPSTLPPDRAALDFGGDRCLTVGPLPPCTIVIFGASGDLTSRKLLPALYNLFANNSLPKPCNIVGCGRAALTTPQFRELMQKACRTAGCLSSAPWEEFAANLHYYPVAYDSPASFGQLATALRALDRDRLTMGNRLFYLATPPLIYPVVAEMISQAGLAREHDGENGQGWTRLVVEKPFGRDLQTATALDLVLHQGFKEQQIFRIDHYLAKETVQNILMFRFANSIFEPLWNRSHIDYVGIIAAEKLGLENRAGYYEQAGVLRDMFQNHMMQLLALTAMEPPSLFMADRVLDEKVKVYRALKPFAGKYPDDNLILGQYGPGQIDGRKVPGYLAEAGVQPASVTPTFALLRLFIDNWRWRGVPFYLASGKRLARKKTVIVIQFKEVPHSMFRDILGDDIVANRLILGIYPEEGIKLTFQTKSPGPRACLRPVNMDFKYYDNYPLPILSAYEKVLLDCLQGDHMLFWRQDGVELSWSFLTPILAECETCANRRENLYQYEAGSWGPEPAMAWLKMILMHR